VELRQYQQQAIAKVYESLKQHRASLLQLPTGAGKTVVLGRIVLAGNRNQKRVLVAAHRSELVSQIQGTLSRYGLNTSRIQAGHGSDYDNPLQVASVQTLVRRKESIIPPAIIIFDEAHHCTAGTYLQVIEAFPNAKILGVTATPTRMDGKPLGDLFTDLIQVVSVSELIESGFLVPPQYFVGASVIGSAKPKVQMGDYQIKDLSKIVQEVELEGELVGEWLRTANGVPTVVFAVTCEHSRRIVEAYREAGIPAEHIDGNCSATERDRILKDFASGKIKILSNVNIVTEGFDLPEIGCVQLARPTKSVAMAFQMIGRALRPSPGKSEAIILDHAGIYGEHGSVTDPIFWSLDDVAKSQYQREREAKEREKGAENTTELVVFGTNDKLVKIDSSFPPDALKTFIKLRGLAIKNDRKKIWIAYRLREEHPDLSQNHWKVVARALGYHHKWIDHFMER